MGKDSGKAMGPVGKAVAGKNKAGGSTSKTTSKTTNKSGKH